MFNPLSVSISIIVELAFWAVAIRWYRRKNKPVGEIVVMEKEDGGFIYAFDFDNYDDPRKIKDRKKVVFKVVRAPLEDSS